jgi:hypothetical protein
MIRVGMVGTFDVENFGDLLFPLIAGRELRARLGDAAVTAFSYHARSAPSWPFDVAPLERLPAALQTLDLLLVGGGDIVRFDDGVALSYRPGSPGVHHPTGFWLAPILLAHAAGTAVAWNAPGVPGSVPAWAHPLVRSALAVSDYVSVRDTASRDALKAVAPDADVAVVPDTAFNAGILLDARRTPGAASPYLVVQNGHEAWRALPALRSRLGTGGGTFVLTPVGPATGDAGRPPRLPKGAEFRPLMPPLDLLALIDGSRGVMGRSLHLSIAALALGRPAFRPPAAAPRKYRLLEGLDGVEHLGARRPGGAGRAGSSPAASQIDVLRRQTAAHWDRIAALATTRGGRPRPAASADVAMELWQRIAGGLERRTVLERLESALRNARRRLRVPSR